MLVARLLVNMVDTACLTCHKIFDLYLFSFVGTPLKFIIAELSIRELESSSVLIILMKIRAYGSKNLQ